MLNNWNKGPVYKKRKSPFRLCREEERYLNFQKKVVKQSSRHYVTDGETDRAKLPVSDCTDSLSPVSSLLVDQNRIRQYNQLL